MAKDSLYIRAEHRLRVVHPDPPGDDGLRLKSYGVRERIRPTIIDRPHGTDDWLIMAFHQPAKVWTEAAGWREAPEGSLVVWRPLAPHRYGHDGQPWLHSWMHLASDQLQGWMDGGPLPLERPIPGVPARLLDRCILLLHDEIARHARPDPHILRAHLQVWIHEAQRAAAGAATAPPGMLAVRTAIESRYAEGLDLGQLAAIAHCSRQHLCAGFKRTFGLTPIDHLIRVRLQHAHLLLQDPARPVATVAADVGFSDYRHFARLYRRRFGHPARRR